MSKSKLIKMLSISSFTSLIINIQTSVAVHAASLNDLNLFGTNELIGGGDSLISKITSFLVTGAYAVAILVIVWGGYKYFLGALSGDNADGKKTIQAGVIGFVIILLADTIVKVVKETFVSGFKSVALVGIIKDVLTLLYSLSAAFAVLALVYGGFLMITGGFADKFSDKNEQGKKAIKAAVIGFVVVILAATIVQLINVMVPAIG